jgi:Pectate lyase superfamily protein
MTTPTQNPIPSGLPQDFRYNIEKTDEVVTSPNDYYTDRFGVRRLTFEGMNRKFNDKIESFGWQEMGDFEAGVIIEGRSQIVFFDGSWYQFVGPLPHTTATNDPNTDGGIFSDANPSGLWVNLGTDLTLRVDLLSDSVNQGDALITVKQPVSGSITRTQHQKNSDFINVKDFGAVGDGFVDDSASVQAAINYAMSLSFGGTVYFPEGRYRILQRLSADRSVDLTKGRVSLIGAGMQSTLIFAPNGFITIFGGYSTDYPEGSASYQCITGMTILGDGNQDVSIGIYLELTAFPFIRDVHIQGFGYGLYGIDVDQAVFDNVRIRFNKRGYLFSKKPAPNPASTQPNNLTFMGCTIGNNALFGGLIIGGSCINMFGGNVENNGIGSESTSGWGLKIQDGGYEGGTGLNCYSVYFESNAWVADVIIINQSAVIPNNMTCGFYSCSFARGTSNYYAIHNIEVSAGDPLVRGIIKLILNGNTFKSAGSYAPNSLRKYVNWDGVDIARPETLVSTGNIFEDEIETPPFVLHNSEFCFASKVGATLVQPSTETNLNLDIVYSSFGIPIYNNGFVVKTSGLYTLSMTAVFDFNGVAEKACLIRKNGAVVSSASSSSMSSISTSCTIRLNAGEGITFSMIHSYSSALNVSGSGAANTSVSIVRVA